MVSKSPAAISSKFGFQNLTDTKNCSYAYYFDMETGNFVRGQMVFADLMADEISADAYLTTSSMFEQYRPDTFTLNR